MAKRKKSPYKGQIKKWAQLAFPYPSNGNFEQADYERVADWIPQRLIPLWQLLFDHYEIRTNDPEAWYRMATALAVEHVHAFQPRRLKQKSSETPERRDARRAILSAHRKRGGSMEKSIDWLMGAGRKELPSCLQDLKRNSLKTELARASKEHKRMLRLLAKLMAPIDPQSTSPSS